MVRAKFIKELNGKTLNILDLVIDFIQYNKLSLFLYHIIRFLKRIPSYIVLAWKQEDWDFDYMYDIIEFKLKRILKCIEKDTWHTEHCVKRCKQQIAICLERLNRFRNWQDYIEYPIDDIKFKPSSQGTGYVLIHCDKQNEKQRQSVLEFETKNFNKFWKDFKTYHTYWWT